MKLSIIIPVFCVEDTLDRCVESVLGQTFTDIEVILVDDGSPDRCPQLCDEWARRDHRLHVLHKKNGGLSSARNAGLDMAQGEWVTFVDSDDFLTADTYAQVMPLTAQADIVEYAIYWHYGAKEQELLTFGNQLYTDMQDYWLRGKAYAHTYACNKIYRRQLFSDVRFPENRVFEDVATLPLLLEKTTCVQTTSQGCYYYCLNSQGITSTATGQQLRMLLESHLEAMSRWCDDEYYMHVLNTQMDVCEMTGDKPIMPRRHINPFGTGLTSLQKAKAIALNLFGIKGICHINKTLHKLIGRRS